MINPENTKTYFDRACEQYGIAKALVEEMSSFVQAVRRDFTYEKAMEQFDLILQSVLLRTAVEDGRFLGAERQFVAKITDYADLMEFVAQKYGINATWDDFSALSGEECKEISLRIFVDLDELIDEFVRPFAVVDAMLPKDYCEELTKAMALIGAYLAACDGDEKDSSDFKNEMTVAFGMIQTAIKEKWSAIVGNGN